MERLLYKSRRFLDFGSGHNPRPGYMTCDVTRSPVLDYVYDSDCHRILDCDDAAFHLVHVRNVCHHVQELERLLHELHRVIEVGGHLYIIEPAESYYKQNVLLDQIWYRAVNHRPEIWFSRTYRDFVGPATRAGFEVLKRGQRSVQDHCLFIKT